MLTGALHLCLLAAMLGPDCNNNGIDDSIDIMDGTSIDCDANGIPDECQPCEDCDGDGMLDHCEAAAANGLVGEYWISTGGAGNFSERVLVRFDDQIFDDWGNGSPDPLIPNDDFTVRWTAALTTPAAGTWTFYTTTDDGVRLWIDGELLIDQWVPQSPTEWSAQIDLAAGPHLLRMEYYEAGGGAIAVLEWEGPGTPRAVVPTSALHPLDDTDGDGWPDGCPDCNGNGIVDAQDILDGTSADCNGNCVPDECDVTPTPPIAYWRFDLGIDPVGDSGPNGLPGASNGLAALLDVPVSPVPRTGEPNLIAAELGGDGYFTVDDTGGLFTMNGASFTFEAWVRLDQLSDTSGTGQRQYLVQKKETASPGSEMDFSIMAQAGNIHDSIPNNFGKDSSITGRELVLQMGTGSETWMVTSFLQITDLDWHHVSVTFDAEQQRVRFTLDDAVDSIGFSDQGHFANSGPLLVGAHTNASGQFNQFLKGSLDEVRMTAGVLPVGSLLNRLAGADCNGNGIPDECDLAGGLSDDCDGNGVPDECDPDCNGNGIPDGCDILDGTSQDCNGDGTPDECQLVGNDCDGNGVPDDCQLLDEDCNGNGIPDSCDIASGLSEDCLPDGIPDECQLGMDSILAYDDGTAEVGVRSDGIHMAWLNGFTVDGAAGVIDAFDVMWIFSPPNATVHMYIWSDPDGDGDPTDAQVLWSGTTNIDEQDVIKRYNVPDLDLGPSGTRFFVGFIMPVTSNDFPGAMDTSGSAALGRSWIIGSNTPIIPNDLSNGAIEFEPIEDALFPGNWIIRAKMLAVGGDCNGNGIPDACDIADGILDDIDGNGIADDCEDCNGNGIPDGLDITDGTSLDCQPDGVPDECQLLNNDCDGDGVPDDCFLADADCNGNGVLDSCDIASGTSVDLDGSGIPDECEDCNGNGVLDAIDIAGGFSQDCQPDGIPDECQFGDPDLPFTYAIDDGQIETNVGVTAAVDMVWLNHFTVQPGAEWIGSVELVWGNTFAGQPGEVVLWSDPDGDGNPADAQVIAMAPTVSANTGTGLYNVVPVTPTYVGPAGTSFFVGVHFDDVFNTAPAAADTSQPDAAAWFHFLVGAQVDLNDLTAAETIFFSYLDFMVRAGAFDGELPLDCNDNGIPDDCDIDAGTSPDENGNGIPDECECLSDLTGDGAVDITDLLELLAHWGDPYTVVDLLDLLGAWGECP
jgi:hypothetical protein